MTHLPENFAGHNFLRKIWRLLQFLPKKLQHTQSRMNGMKLTVVNFIRKSWSKSFNKGIVYERVDFDVSAQLFPDKTLSSLSLITGTPESGILKGGCNFGNLLPDFVQNLQGGKVHIFWWKTFQIVWISLPRTRPFPSNSQVVEAMNIVIQERHNHSGRCITVQITGERLRLWVTLQMKDVVLNFSVRGLGTNFQKQCRLLILSNVEMKRTSQNRICLRYCSHTFSQDLNSLDWVQ